MKNTWQYNGVFGHTSKSSKSKSSKSSSSSSSHGSSKSAKTSPMPRGADIDSSTDYHLLQAFGLGKSHKSSKSKSSKSKSSKSTSSKSHKSSKTYHHYYSFSYHFGSRSADDGTESPTDSLSHQGIAGTPDQMIQSEMNGENVPPTGGWLTHDFVKVLKNEDILIEPLKNDVHIPNGKLYKEETYDLSSC